MAEAGGQSRRQGRAGFFSWLFWLWLAGSAAYTIPVTYYADTSRPTQDEIRKAWIYDGLALIADHNGTRGGIAEGSFPLVPEEQQLELIEEFWTAEAAAYRATYRIEPGFLGPVRALNARYIARLEAGPAERVEAQVEALRTWVPPVVAGFLVVVLGYLRARRTAGQSGAGTAELQRPGYSGAETASPT
jgi:hypothetical protein